MDRKFSRRKFLKGLAVAAGSGVLVACAPKVVKETVVVEGTPQVVEKVVTVAAPRYTRTEVTVPTWWAPHEIEGGQIAFDNYFTPETGIKVTLEATVPDYWGKVLARLASDDPYDLLNLGGNLLQQYVEKGVALQLDDLIARDRYDLNDFLPEAIEAWKREGHVWGLPYDAYTGYCLFNKDLFQEAGLEVPKPTDDWTWDQLREWAKALTVKSGDQTTQYGFVCEPNWWWELWPNLTGEFVFDEKLSKSLLDEPTVIEAFQFYSDLIHKDGTTLRPGSMESFVGDIFIAGQNAILLGGTWEIGYMRANQEDIDFTWDVGLPPQNASAKDWYIPYGTGGACVPKNAVDIEASWAVLKFMASRVFAEEAMFRALSSFPCRKSVLDGAGFDQWPERPPEGHTIEFADKINKHTRLLRHEKVDLGPEISALMNKLDMIYSGEAQPAELLPGLAEDVNTELAKRPWNQ